VSPSVVALVVLGTVALVLILSAPNRRGSGGERGTASYLPTDGSQVLRRALPHAARQFLSAAVQSGARIVIVGRRSPPINTLLSAVLGLRADQSRPVRVGGNLEVLGYVSGETDAVAFLEAGDPTDALFALESRYASSKPILAELAVSRAVAKGVDLLVWVGVTTSGIPLVREISQPVVAEGDMGSRLAVQPIFRWASTERELRPVGIRPRALNRMAQAGIRVPDHLFDYRGVSAGSA